MSWENLCNRTDAGGCYVIAEAGLNHNGSVEIARSLIDLAAIAGADAVKFQKRTVSELAIDSVLDAADDRFPEFGRTYREIREHLEFDLEQYRTLKAHAESKGLDFIVTAFDVDAVDFLQELDVEIYKIASHGVTNLSLLDYAARKGRPLIVSTGMTDLDEVDTAVGIACRYDSPVVLLHCVSAYPTPLDECNLAMMEALRSRFRLPVGYSGHELGYLATLSAVAMGATIVERHYTLDSRMLGFDHAISLEPDELIAMVRSIRDISTIRGTGRKQISRKEWATRRKYHVSMVSAQAIAAGAILSEEMVAYRNPGIGIPPKDAARVLGRRALRDIDAGELLSVEMFE